MAEKSPLWLGVDGGGTKTVAMVIDAENNQVSSGEAGPSNRRAVGDETAAKAIATAVRTALDGIGNEKRITGWCIGIAGSVLQRDGPWLWHVCAPLLPNVPVYFTHDAEVALVGATGQRLGVVIIGGTGSIAFGVNPAGRSARAGGWGHVLGDEGSGYAIGLAGLQAALRDYDGRGAATELTNGLMHHLKLSIWDAIVGEVYEDRLNVTQIASLARLVVDAALQGDEVAKQIVASAGQELGLAVVAVLRRLGWPTNQVSEVALAGSLLRTESPITDELRQTVLRYYPQARFLTPRWNAAMGAAFLAKGRFA